MSDIKCKKPTNKDVAAFAGVSVATVSYVVNGRTDKRIPEATKKKVLHAINFLGYIPNPHATAIKAGVKDIIVKGAKNALFLREAEDFYFLKKLTATCAEKDYVVTFSTETTPKRMTATACVALGVDTEDFKLIANENFIPIVAVDALVNDPIFFQVTNDYEKVRKTAEARFGNDYVFLAVATENKNLEKEILSVLPNTRFVKELSDLTDLPKTNIVCQDGILPVILKEKVALVVATADEKIRAVIDCVEKAVERTVESESEHFVKV